MVPACLPGEVKCIANDAVCAVTGEHGFLNHQFPFRAGVTRTADLRILAFRVLTNDPEIDVSGFAVSHGRFDTGQQAHGSKVYVLIELAANRDEEAPQGNMIRDAGEADCPQENGVMFTEPRDSIFG